MENCKASASGNVPAHIRELEKQADKGRIRRLKEKVMRVLLLPKRTREKLLSTTWKALFAEVRPNIFFKTGKLAE